MSGQSRLAGSRILMEPAVLLARSALHEYRDSVSYAGNDDEDSEVPNRIKQTVRFKDQTVLQVAISAQHVAILAKPKEQEPAQVEQ